MTSIKNIKSDGVVKYAEGSLKNFFTADAFTNRKNDIAAVREMIIKTSVQTLCDTLLALANRKETCSILSDFKIPVLILVGKEDVITPPATALIMNEKIKNSSLHIIENAGHLSNIQNPMNFNHRVKEFLSSGF
jgi:pimeloyl-ACP methyl ester carboxylesterase